MKNNSLWNMLLAGMLLTSRSLGGVVINEIFYHAPDDLDELEWIELHNTDAKAADISGWRLANGIEFTFPEKTTITAGGFIVLCKDKKLFAEFYDVPAIGEFKRSLNNGGNAIDLIDAANHLVDKVKYNARSPWPNSAAGRSSSLERITPDVPLNRADNWAASPLPEDMERPTGTPGRTNASYSANFPPE